jgi:hypothetical protein
MVRHELAHSRYFQLLLHTQKLSHVHAGMKKHFYFTKKVKCSLEKSCC